MNLSMHSKDRTMSLGLTNPSRDGFWYLLGLAVSVTAGVATYGLDLTNSESLVKTLTITSGTLLGFLITSLSILLAISNNSMVKKLREAGKINNLVSQVFIVSLVFTLAIALSIIHLITFNMYFSAAVAGLVFFGLIVFCRIGYKYKLLFTIMD